MSVATPPPDLNVPVMGGVVDGLLEVTVNAAARVPV
jgi:hypothetical protein